MRSLTIARIRGIGIEVHPSWLVILALVSWTLSSEVFPDTYDSWSKAAYWIVGISAALLLFVTVLLHELAHALVAIHRGLAVPKITLFIFGGVSHLSRQPRTAREEFLIAIAGPLTSFVLAIGTGVASLLVANEKGEGILAYLATVNLLLGVFNLLPGFPLDGGRVFRSIAWGRMHNFTKATLLAGRVGEFCAFALIGLGLVLFVLGYTLNGLWFALIGWFLYSAARAEAGGAQLEAILRKLTARDVMDVTVMAVPPETPLQVVVDERLLGRGDRAVIVAEEGKVRGIVGVTDLQGVPREEWATRTAGSAMVPVEKLATVRAATPAIEVLALLGELRLNQVPVIEEGHLLGVVSRRDLLDRIQRTASVQAER